MFKRPLRPKDDNQDAWSMSTVKVLNGAGVSGDEVQVDSRQTGSGQMQSSKTEGRSSYWGRDEETCSGAEGRSDTRRAVWNRVLTIWQSLEELVQS